MAHGHIAIYKVRGTYQFYVDQVQQAGTGALFLQFQLLKDKLQEEGLFAEERKRTLPPFRAWLEWSLRRQGPRYATS